MKNGISQVYLRPKNYVSVSDWTGLYLSKTYISLSFVYSTVIFEQNCRLAEKMVHAQYFHILLKINKW